MKLFFDCEMTELHRGSTLISLGIVDENNRYFYAEFTDYDKSARYLSPFIQENVIKNLWFNKYPDGPLSHKIYDPTDGSVQLKGNTLNVKAELESWLSVYDRIEWIADVPTYDFMLLIDLLWYNAIDIPYDGKFSPDCYNISQAIQDFLGCDSFTAFDKNREDLLKELGGPKVEGVKHNSLYDARVCKALYYVLKNK